MTTGEMIVPQQRSPMMAGGRPQPIVPQSMEDCYRLAGAICKAGMAPKGLETPEKAMLAIMHGLEVGLTPLAALQRIAVVNGRPTIWGDGAIGLVRGSGICEWIRETVAGSGDTAAATCEAKRRGDPEIVKRAFSVADAKKAGLWGKQGPWQQYPARMLAMRARAFCLRDGFADVLGGLYIREEIEEDHGRKAPAPPQVLQAAAPQIEHRPIEAATSTPRRAPVPPMAKAQPAAEPPKKGIVDAFSERAAAAQSLEELGEVWNDIVEPAWDAMSPDDQDACERVNRHRCAELPNADDDGGEAGEP